jgi:hypothetical protein
MLIDDLKPEVGEFVLMHDLGARLPRLVDRFNQVSDLNPDGIARNVVIKVHIEEVTGHGREPVLMVWACCADARKAEDPASVVNEWQSDRAFDQSGNSGIRQH